MKKLHTVFTIPNCLTLLRIFSIPFVVQALYNNYWVAASVLFSLCSITDVVDGYIARRYKQQTLLGAFLDPLADKLLMMCVFGALSYKAAGSFAIPAWFIALVIVKELVLIAGALVLFCMKYRISIRPTSLGKLAMATQVLLVAWVFGTHFFGITFSAIHQIFLYAVAAIMVSAFVDYALRVYTIVKNIPHKQKDNA